MLLFYGYCFDSFLLFNSSVLSPLIFSVDILSICKFVCQFAKEFLLHIIIESFFRASDVLKILSSIGKHRSASSRVHDNMLLAQMKDI